MYSPLGCQDSKKEEIGEVSLTEGLVSSEKDDR